MPDTPCLTFYLNGFFVNRQFFEDIPFNHRGDGSRSLGSPVLETEVLRILLIQVQKYEKPSSLDPQDLLDIGSFHFILQITVKKLFDLL
jgi:hypothetical protein